MKCIVTVLIGALLVLASVKTVSATTITFTFAGTGSGDVGGTNFVGGTSFTNQPFTITAIADTTNITSCGAPCIYVDSTSSTIAITGFSLANVTSGTRVFDNFALGYSRAGAGGKDLLNMADPAFLTYGLSTSLGPIFNAIPIIIVPNQFDCAFGCVTSNLGNIEFSSITNVTFNAVTGAAGVPEPATLTLLGIGSLAVGIARRLRRKA